MKTPSNAPRRSKKKSSPLLALLLLLILAALGGMLFIRFRSAQISPSGDPAAPGTGEPDAVYAVGTLDELLAMDEPDSLDLRDRELSFEDYTRLRERFPDCAIRWMVPLSGGSFDSASEQLSIDAFAPEDLDLLACFDRLAELDARSVSLSAEEADRICETLPEARLLWMVPAGGERFDSSTANLKLPSLGLDADELASLLRRFDRLESVSVSDANYTPREQAAVSEQFPEVLFSWSVAVCGLSIPSQTDTITLPNATEEQLQELEDSAAAFRQVAHLELPQAVLSPARAASLSRAFGGAQIHGSLSLFGQEIDCAAEEIDLSGTAVDDLSVFDDVIAAMPQLKKVVMCDCGVPDEEMDALNHRYEGVRFVWTIHMAIYALRTDATYFCASDLPYRNNVGLSLTDEQLSPIKYCTDLVALDLGHMQYTDISFLEHMPHLRYLVMVTCKYTDISPIGSLHELYYLEIFHNHLDDLTPLLSCESLRYLNIGYSEGFDTAPLYQMQQLERLWFPGNAMTEEEKAALQSALPDTECYLPTYDADGSTGGGWRESDAYREMRDALHMYYMPGGTGMHNT